MIKYNVVYVNKATGLESVVETSEDYEDIVDLYQSRLSLAETLRYRLEYHEVPYTYANLIDNERPVSYFMIEEVESDDTSDKQP